VATFKHMNGHGGIIFIHKIRCRFSYQAKTERESMFDLNIKVLITMKQFIMLFLKTTTTTIHHHSKIPEQVSKLYNMIKELT